MSMPDLNVSLENRIVPAAASPAFGREASLAFKIGKRLTDLICITAASLPLALVCALVALFIKMEDPGGKVIFSQIRIGKNGKPFRLYKFRSMQANAEEMLEALLDQNEIVGAMFKIKEDPRVTKVGRVIRRLSLDELPQLWNVLKGEMSLVGPRPPLPREVRLYTPYELQRLLVTPGCTGLWQVSGRSSTSFQDMVEIDLKYIAERSLLNDFMIILKTLKVFFGSKHAF
ncbi:sugar transferase [Cohnella hongkongensis]|uniref:Sugar transferase n=1 Tax=Cohnella hongkongensis TaxID=178337 RepID=A0ABV9F673_9BACL